jgi:GTPase SAR1 family protein
VHSLPFVASNIAPQDRFHNLTRNYYREASGAIIVFDQTSPRSFLKILDWKNDLDSKSG